MPARPGEDPGSACASVPAHPWAGSRHGEAFGDQGIRNIWHEVGWTRFETRRRCSSRLKSGPPKPETILAIPVISNSFVLLDAARRHQHQLSGEFGGPSESHSDGDPAAQRIADEMGLADPVLVQRVGDGVGEQPQRVIDPLRVFDEAP